MARQVEHHSARKSEEFCWKISLYFSIDDRVTVFLGKNLGFDSCSVHVFLDNSGTVRDTFSLGGYAGLSEECAKVSEEWFLVFLDVIEGLSQALLFHGTFDKKNALIASSRKTGFEACFPALA